jgi:hypothetical protein
LVNRGSTADGRHSQRDEGRIGLIECPKIVDGGDAALIVENDARRGLNKNMRMGAGTRARSDNSDDDQTGADEAGTLAKAGSHQNLDPRPSDWRRESDVSVENPHNISLFPLQLSVHATSIIRGARRFRLATVKKN